MKRTRNRITSRFALVGILLCLGSRTLAAQGVAGERRYVVLADIGRARTWDDEGLLGSGTSLAGGVGVRLTSGVTLQAIIERIPYYRDVEWLTFDGRVLFAGLEADFHVTKRRVRPFATVGIGMFDDAGVWIRKTRIGPGLTRVDERIDRAYRLSAMTASAGLDWRLIDRASIRTILRFHSLLNTGDDLAPHKIIQPAVGIAWRW